jgi:DNA-binding NarL/FixJ family response regulator
MQGTGQGTNSPNPWSVMVVESCEIYRKGLENALRSSSNLVVVASCQLMESAKEALAVHHVDCLVLGIQDSQGAFEALKFIKWIKATSPKVAIAVLMEDMDPDCARRLLRGGVRGLLGRKVSQQGLLVAILRAISGVMEIDKTLTNHLLSHAFIQTREPYTASWKLTDKEAEVLDAYASGAAPSSISTKLGLSQRTVNCHLAKAKEKLGARSSRELLVQAVKWRCGRRPFQSENAVMDVA